MRYLFGFLCVCALGVMPLVGCTDDGGDGGSGGTAGTGGDGGTAGEYSWGAPERIDDEGAVNYDVPTELAVNASGAAVAVWTTSWDGEIWTNRYAPDNGWGSAERIEIEAEGYVSSFPPPQVAIAPNGSAMIVWLQDQPDAIWGSHFTPSAGWEPAEQIDRGFQDYGVHGPDVAMDADGNAIAVWRRSATDNTVVASRYTPDGGWGEVQRIDDGSAEGSYETGIAMAANGGAIAIWTTFQTERGSIFANRYTSTGGWETPEAIDNPEPGTNLPEGPQVVMDGSGNGIVVWLQDYPADIGYLRRVTANRYTPDGGWEDAEMIEGGKGTYSYLPHVSMNANGTAMVVWPGFNRDPEPGGVWSIRYTPDSGWHTEELVEAYPALSALYPQVAVDPTGNAVAVWQSYGSYGSTQQNVWSSHYTSSEGWGTSVRIDHGLGVFSPPRLGVDASGKAIAVWAQSSASFSGVWANRFDDSPKEDNSDVWQALCDAICERTLVCVPNEGTVAECASECMGELGGRPCAPNPGALVTCVNEVASLPCEDLELGRVPYACELVCVGDLLCSDGCEDGNECTKDLCDPANGSCTYTPVADETPCGDGTGTCQNGVCGT